MRYALTQVMKQAMQTLKTFSEKDRDYFLYQSRQEYLRVQKDTVGRLEEKLIETREALGQTEQKLGQTEQKLGHAEAEIERLRAMLEQK